MYPKFDRSKLHVKPLAIRHSKKKLGDMYQEDRSLPEMTCEAEKIINITAESMLHAKQMGAPTIVVYGAHLYRNGLGPEIVKLMEAGYVQHLATNGAGTIHDWEIAFHGQTTEDVQLYLKEGQFGIWQETGFFINLAIILGVSQGLGYGTSIAKMIDEEKLVLPSKRQLREELEAGLRQSVLPENYNAKATLLHTLETENLEEGELIVPHPNKNHSLQYAAYRLNIPMSVCPGIGYDIIYTHPINNGAAIGIGAVNDFLALAKTISNLENGVILSIGSSVMAPMIVEKSISMARNIAHQENRKIENFYTIVNDIQPGSWDWRQGEPPKGHPAYFLRFCKSFFRMGGHFEYLELDNRAFVRHLVHKLGLIS